MARLKYGVQYGFQVGHVSYLKETLHNTFDCVLDVSPA